MNWEQEHKNRIQANAAKIDLIYQKAVKEAALVGATVSNFNPDKPFSFSDYPGTKQRIDKLITSMTAQIQTVVVNGCTTEWEQSNFKNNELARQMLGFDKPSAITGQLDMFAPPPEAATNPALAKYFNNNDDARAAFLARKTGGMNLSDRVWKQTGQFKTELEMALDGGIRNGEGAASMARDLRQFLKEPDRFYRRFQMNLKDKNGNDVLDSNGNKIVIKQLRRQYTDPITGAKTWKVENPKYKPGQGVYRSSVKNSQRLSRTENNMAYRTADHTRMQQFDFVVGQEVKLSKAHKIYDICDVLKGKYPKEFIYKGWHPQCFCPVTFIMKTPEELKIETEQILNGEPTNGLSVNQVTAMPKDFTQWAANNTERIQNANTVPYFIQDNFIAGDITKGLTYEGVQATNAAQAAKDIAAQNAKVQDAIKAEADKAIAAKAAAEAAKQVVIDSKYTVSVPESTQTLTLPDDTQITGTVKRMPIDKIKPSEDHATADNESARGYALGEYPAIINGREQMVYSGKVVNPNQLPTIVVDKNGLIIDGNNRYAAAKFHTNLTHMNVIQTDFTREEWIAGINRPAINVADLTQHEAALKRARDVAEKANRRAEQYSPTDTSRAARIARIDAANARTALRRYESMDIPVQAEARRAEKAANSPAGLAITRGKRKLEEATTHELQLTPQYAALEQAINAIPPKAETIQYRIVEINKAIKKKKDEAIRAARLATKAETARIAEEARIIEAARIAELARLEAIRVAELARLEAIRLAEVARLANIARLLEAERIEAARVAALGNNTDAAILAAWKAKATNKLAEAQSLGVTGDIIGKTISALADPSTKWERYRYLVVQLGLKITAARAANGTATATTTATTPMQAAVQASRAARAAASAAITETTVVTAATTEADLLLILKAKLKANRASGFEGNYMDWWDGFINGNNSIQGGVTMRQELMRGIHRMDEFSNSLRTRNWTGPAIAHFKGVMPPAPPMAARANGLPNLAETETALTKRGWGVKIYPTDKSAIDTRLANLDTNKMLKEVEELLKKEGVTVTNRNIFFKNDSLEYTILGNQIGGPGNSSFRLTRTFNYGQGSPRSIDHDFLHIPDGLEGGGASKRLFQTLYKNYQDFGAERIDVHANINVGGYTWGQYGFRVNPRYDSQVFIKGQEAKAVQWIMNNYAGYSGNVTQDDKEEIEKVFKKYLSNHASTSNFPMNLISGIKGKVTQQRQANGKMMDITTGKRIMLGSNWYGWIDLKDADNRSVFENYLFGGKKH